MLDLVLCWATMLPGATIVGRAADCVCILCQRIDRAALRPCAPRVSPCTQGADAGRRERSSFRQRLDGRTGGSRPVACGQGIQSRRSVRAGDQTIGPV